MGKMSASQKAKARKRAKTAPRYKDGRFKKGGRKLSGGKKKKSSSAKKKYASKTAYQKKMRALALRRPRDRYGRFAGMGGGLGKFRAASLLPAEIDMGMILLGDALGITLATAAPKIVGVLVKPESANLAARITKIGLGVAGLAGYFAFKRSLTLGFAFGTMPAAVEAAANWIGDSLGTAIGEAKEKKGEAAAIPGKTPAPLPPGPATEGLGQIDPEQIEELEMIAERTEGVGRYGASSVRGIGDIEYREEEIEESPDVAMPMEGSVLAGRWG